MSDIEEAIRKLNAEALISTWEASLVREDMADEAEGLDDDEADKAAEELFDEAYKLCPALGDIAIHLHDTALEDGNSKQLAEGILSGFTIFAAMIIEHEKQYALQMKLSE